MSTLHAIIMAGGSGTRFWPASRARRPKQFLPLAPGGQSLIGATVDRLAPLIPQERVWIVTNEDQCEGLLECLPDFDPKRILVEPEARDTAACIALSVAKIAAIDPTATLIVLPSDHVIEPQQRFLEVLRRGIEIAADRETLVTFGIRPTRPATGFGYIEPGEELASSGIPARRIRRFREKPNLDTAQEFVASGHFLWNSGIFIYTVEAVLESMRRGHEELAAAASAMIDAERNQDADAFEAAFRSAPKTSFDYAVMEHAARAVVVEADFRWSDLGSFLALDTITDPDQAGNVSYLQQGAATSMLDARDCVVYAEGKRTVALLGTHDLVCVAVGDAVLVCPRHRMDDMKSLVQQLREEGRTDLL